MGGARVTTLVTLRKCTLGNKREIKTLKFVSASTKSFQGGLAWIKPSNKNMAVTFSYSHQPAQGGVWVPHLGWVHTLIAPPTDPRPAPSTGGRGRVAPPPRPKTLHIPR